MKFKYGAITNMSGVVKDVVVKAAAPNKLKDALIGGGMVMMGIAYLTSTAFRYGVEKFEEAEYQTMSDLGLIENIEAQCE